MPRVVLLADIAVLTRVCLLNKASADRFEYIYLKKLVEFNIYS